MRQSAIETAWRMMKLGQSLDFAAKRLEVDPSDLDLAIWRWRAILQSQSQ